MRPSVSSPSSFGSLTGRSRASRTARSTGIISPALSRVGKLINANTRCVLLRELFEYGQVANDRLRVAVLPATFTAAEELQLESVLQQLEHKDEYNLVSELIMLRKISEEAVWSETCARSST